MEVWKDIPGYEGLYRVSNLGRVCSIGRFDRLGRYRGNCMLSDCDNGNGYRVVNLKHNGKQKMKTVHRLVAESFIPNPKGLLEINHKDGNKTNNNADNLEWCTRSENVKHACTTGLHTEFGQKKVMCVETGQIFNSTRKAEEWVGIKSGNGRIANVCANRRGAKTCGGYHWRWV